MNAIRLGLCLCATAAFCAARPAHAIRPFVTDDARVVGHRLAQVETWMVLDRLALEHNVFGAVGPTSWLEVTAGLSHGRAHEGAERGHSLTGPILQAKALLLPARDNGRPGVAVAVGALPPAGYGAFKPPGWGGFGYLAVTESLFTEGLLVHANVGLALGAKDEGAGGGGTASRGGGSGAETLLTGGLGAQARLVAGLHVVAETYYGDPFDVRTDFPAMQAGFRYIFSENVQLDGTFGSTLTAVSGPQGGSQIERWGTLGLRLVSPELW